MPAGTQTSELKEIALETGVTAVMLSRLSPRVTVAKLLSALDENARDLYDFVYLPQDKRKHRNVGLAFVNFANHETALRAAEYFMANSLEQGLWSNVVVGKANIQGLQSNLAYFVARCGLEALDNANAPLVFEGGVPVAHIREAIRKHVSVAMILEAQTKIKVEKTNSKSETSGMFAGPKEMASAWKSKSVETIWKSGFQAPPGLKVADMSPFLMERTATWSGRNMPLPGVSGFELAAGRRDQMSPEVAKRTVTWEGRMNPMWSLAETSDRREGHIANPPPGLAAPRVEQMGQGKEDVLEVVQTMDSTGKVIFHV
ncbi:unnamed protein product [Effrenium voratum]|uniref:Mei2-like C-terminal RNA recognition motif domain-containing protein n=1 Tax=Effrenium voratum TaxID=2562239 RepID=A0AA36JNN1_9DINO|nr:unnamed protein product [Effrenium voratum]